MPKTPKVNVNINPEILIGQIAKETINELIKAKIDTFLMYYREYCKINSKLFDEDLYKILDLTLDDSISDKSRREILSTGGF